jgi:hypothetical protein
MFLVVGWRNSTGRQNKPNFTAALIADVEIGRFTNDLCGGGG